MKNFKLLVTAIFFLGMAAINVSAQVAGVDEDKTAVEEEKPVETAESQSVEAEGISALVEEVEGTVNVQRKGSDKWEFLSVKNEVNEGDQVLVGEEGKLVVDIDGDKVILSGGTLFTFKKLTMEKKLELWRGKMRAKVKKLTRADKFEIITPVANCAVKGTEFSVAVGADGATKVQTFSGLVSLKGNATGKEVMIEEGNESEVGQDGKPSKPKKIKVEKEKDKKETEVTEEEAEEERPAEEKKAKAKKTGTGSALTMNGSFGADVLRNPDNPDEQKIYYNLSLLPEIAFWKIGIGLDIRLYFDEEGNLREEEWDDWNDVLDKVWYVRYGREEDTLYILAGGLRGFMLGNGFIISGYTNMLNYPEIRKIGGVLKLDLGRSGMKVFISDVNKYPIYGGRFFHRPLMNSGIPIVRSLELGVSGVTDRNPDSADRTDDDEVLFYGADAKLSLLTMPAFTSGLFFSYATYQLGDVYDSENEGAGNAVGLMGKVIKIFNYRMEYRKIDNNFIPCYFDTYYDVERESKPYTIGNSRSPSMEGPFVGLGLSLVEKLDFGVTWEDYNIDPTSRYPYLHGKLSIAPELLMNKYSLSVSYSKKNVNTCKDITELSGAIMVTELGYKIAPNASLYIVQKQTFSEEGEPEKTMSVRMGFGF
ncbi:FecR domain-containing protein [Elusimicrobiota bacterium]